MAGYQKIQIIGNVGRDPEMRFTSQGKAVTSFSVAVTRRFGSREGGQDEETLWFRVSAWEGLAEICNQYLTKGKQVFIEGRLRPPSVYTDRNGAPRASLEITASEMQMLGSKGDAGIGQVPDDSDGYDDEPAAPRPAPRPAPSSAAPARNKPQPISDDVESEDEIPF